MLAKIPLRSTLMYESQVIEVIDGNQTYLGIKGDAYSKWINISESVICDPLLLIFIGTFNFIYLSPYSIHFSTRRTMTNLTIWVGQFIYKSLD